MAEYRKRVRLLIALAVVIAVIITVSQINAEAKAGAPLIVKDNNVTRNEAYHPGSLFLQIPLNVTTSDGTLQYLVMYQPPVYGPNLSATQNGSYIYEWTLLGVIQIALLNERNSKFHTIGIAFPELTYMDSAGTYNLGLGPLYAENESMNYSCSSRIFPAKSFVAANPPFELPQSLMKQLYIPLRGVTRYNYSSVARNLTLSFTLFDYQMSKGLYLYTKAADVSMNLYMPYMNSVRV